ncbi:MAG: OB-fold domain-containing protein [Phreatobacter sp.]|uniref:Zn-ribbon domain-containing OB-fold protein n=1 Tax=Phreatobacter sp. TaxID=1966341 RepID=UPI001A3D7EB5|nr:OB-fold domain-containing protein [Phreatobacter sp.]MBL8567691.1 OB-fold domain-containing protein [Phreatobacter sp.]
MSGIALLKCRTCGHHWQFSRATCPACAAIDPQPAEASGSGTVWSVTTVHRAPLPEWDVPGGYGIALVTLDEGARIMCRADKGLAIGERVVVTLRDGLPHAARS